MGSLSWSKRPPLTPYALPGPRWRPMKYLNRSWGPACSDPKMSVNEEKRSIWQLWIKLNHQERGSQFYQYVYIASYWIVLNFLPVPGRGGEQQSPEPHRGSCWRRWGDGQVQPKGGGVWLWTALGLQTSPPPSRETGIKSSLHQGISVQLKGWSLCFKSCWS